MHTQAGLQVGYTVLIRLGVFALTQDSVGVSKAVQHILLLRVCACLTACLRGPWLFVTEVVMDVLKHLMIQIIYGSEGMMSFYTQQ